jgi:hypothetical protein
VPRTLCVVAVALPIGKMSPWAALRRIRPTNLLSGCNSYESLGTHLPLWRGSAVSTREGRSGDLRLSGGGRPRFGGAVCPVKRGPSPTQAVYFCVEFSGLRVVLETAAGASEVA